MFAAAGNQQTEGLEISRLTRYRYVICASVCIGIAERTQFNYTFKNRYTPRPAFSAEENRKELYTYGYISYTTGRFVCQGKKFQLPSKRWHMGMNERTQTRRSRCPEDNIRIRRCLKTIAN